MKLKWTLEKLQEEADKYLTRVEFKEKSKGAYKKATEFKCLNNLFENHINNGFVLNRKPDGYWTKEKLQEIANVSITRTIFRENKKAYMAAIRSNVLDDLFKNHINNGFDLNRKPDGYWTKEKLQEIANDFDNRNDFMINSPSAYSAAQDKNILNELFKNHLNNGYKIDFTVIWNKEKLQEIANLYKNRKDFEQFDNLAYGAAKKKKIMNELFKNHINNGYDISIKIRGYWTEEKLQEIANLYDSRIDFQMNNGGAYSAAHRKKILDDLFKNHINSGYSYKKWDTNSYVIYVYELIDFNSAYIGLTNNIYRRDKEHLYNFDEPLNKFCQKNKIPYPNYKILEANLNSLDAQKQEGYWIKYYNNWNLFNISKFGSLGGLAKKWTLRLLQKEANECEYRGVFWEYHRKAYNVAQKRKLIDELFKNHPNKGYKKRKLD